MLRQITACNENIERLRKYNLRMEKLLHGVHWCKEKENRFLLASTMNRKSSNEAKLYQRRFGLDIGENALMVMIINHEIAYLERTWAPHSYSFLILKNHLREAD